MLSSRFDNVNNRREVFTPEVIDAVVDDFYGRVRADPLLAPVFAARIEDWRPHLVRMGSFWRSILRGDGSFKPSPRGGPPQLHAGLHEVDVSHFQRWIALFEQTARAHFDEEAALYILGRAHRMGRVLSSHLAQPFVGPPRPHAQA